MNSDFSQLSAEERELRLTALLLGELPPAEADQLRAALAADAELAREHNRLQQTIELVRETSAMDRKSAADGTPLRLDEQRRSKLLAAFQQPAPVAKAASKPRRSFRPYAPLALAAALVGLLLLSMGLPTLSKFKARAERLTPLPAFGGGPATLTVNNFDVAQAADDYAGRAKLNESSARAMGDSEVVLADEFTVFKREPSLARPSAPASKPRPAVALALPATTDADDDGGRLLGNVSDLSDDQLLTKGLTQQIKRPESIRALTRADESVRAASGSIVFNEVMANPVPAPAASSQLSLHSVTTMSGRESVAPATDAYTVVEHLAAGATDSTTVDYFTESVNDGRLGSLPATAPVPWDVEKKDRAGLVAGGGSVTFLKQGAVHMGSDSFSAAPSMPVASAPKREMTPTEAQGIIEARRLQLPASGPATPGILPPTALGRTLAAEKLAADGKLLYETGRAKEAEDTLRQAVQSDPENKAAAYYLDLVNAKSYAEEARVREINSRQLLTEVEQAWSEPSARSTTLAGQLSDLNRNEAFGLGFNSQVDPAWAKDRAVAQAGIAPTFGGGGGRGGGGGGNRSLGSGSGGGGTYGGVSIAPGGSRDRFGGMDAVTDGLVVTPPPPVSASAGLGKVTEFDTAARTPHPVDQPDQFGFVELANSTPAAEGMVDALEAIRKTPSNAGGAGVSSRGDSPNNFFRSRMLLEPSSGGRVSVTRSPAPAPVKEAVRFADDGAALFVNGATVASTNALVSNHYWGMNAIHSAADQGSAWFGNTAQDNVQWDFFAPIADGEKTAPSEGRFKTTGDSSGLNRGWVSADAGIAKEQPVGGVDGRLGGSGPRTSRRMNSVVNRAGEVVVSDPVANTSPMTREFFADDFDIVPTSERGRAAGDVNGRVTVQLPALAGEPQLSRQSSPTRPVEAKQLAQIVDDTAVTELRTDVAQAQRLRDKLELNIQATEMEMKVPKLGVVEILDSAEADAPAKPTLWGKIATAFGGDVQRSVRISAEQDMPDVDASGRGFVAGYRPTPDPYFTQTELERIQSKPVLEKVVEKLKLDEAWGNKSTGKKLSEDEAVVLLRKKLDVRQDSKTTLIDIRAKSESAEEAARLANAVAQAYADTRKERHDELVKGGMVALRQQLAEKDQKLAEQTKQLAEQLKESGLERAEVSRPKPSTNSPTPQPEVLTRDNAFSTFSLNVSDVSFKLAAASLEKGAMPDVATVRSEEFINAFDYRDPMPLAGVPLGFVSERARYLFAHNRDVLRFSVKTAAQGRDGGRPLNIVLLLDNSGSMERADRVRIIQEALRALAAQLQPQDKLSVVTFSRTARLWADGVSGAQAAEVANKIAALTPEGGTNLEEALDLAYRTALRHYAATAINRVVLLTDGAANLGNVEPATLKAKVESFRKQGVALDCFGIGWEGFNDDLLENLSRNGDGRYGFVNTSEEASTEFAAQLAGALQVAASDVKVQVEFNPKRVTAYRQIGYAKHQLTKQQFRDNKVDAAEISASEAGNALYVIETNPRGEGPIATVRARFRIPQTSDYREHEWVVPFGSAVELEQSSSALRLATSASAFSEWLAGSPFAGEVTTDRLLGLLSGVPEVYGADPRPKKLEWMIRQAKSISGK